MNVLTDPLIAVRTMEGTRLLSLPEVVVALNGGSVTRLTGPTAIQRQYLWRLLVRCAAHARAVDVGLLEDVDALRQFLADAAQGIEAWALYRTDGGPAFLQVPVRMESDAPAGFRLEDLSRLTVVPGDKNHEFKRGTLSAMTGPEVLLALVEYQFGAIYTKGNYESQVMAGGSGKGSGSPFMAPWWPDLGRTFRSHVEASHELAGYVQDVLGLTGTSWALWTEPWDDDATPLPAVRLAPQFIPLARQVRLRPPDASGVFSEPWLRPTRARRVTDHNEGSGLGDPFTPFVSKGAGEKVRGVMQEGFSYREIARLLFRANMESGPSGRPSHAVAYAARTTQEALLPVQMEGMAFDQGKTVGFHRRLVSVPAEVIVDPEPVAVLVTAMLRDARVAEQALTSAIRVWLHGSAKPKSGDRARMERLRAGLTASIDEAFVARLPGMRGALTYDELEHRQVAWRHQLRTFAGRELQQVHESTPVPNARRYERQVASLAALYGSLKREDWPVSSLDGTKQREEAHV